MEEKIKTLGEIVEISTKSKASGKRVVFCHGVFDIFHFGHATLLIEAKKLGDILIVGVDCDKNTRLLKGENRPINNVHARMFVLSCLSSVDFVFLIPPFNSKNHLVISRYYSDKIYKKIMPSVVATSIRAGKYGKKKKVQAEKLGIEFVDIDHGIYDKGTTKTIEILGIK